MQQSKTLFTPMQRIRIGYVLLLLVFSLFVIRLFYLQVIRHNDYSAAAINKQLKEYEIPAERGIIAVQNGDQTVPIVLNEIKYTVFADPLFVEDPETSAEKVAEITGGDVDKYKEMMKMDTRFAILEKKQSESVRDAIIELELKGVGVREAVFRTYPQGSLASQLVGFVNNEGEGRYGIEEALNDSLKGEAGRLKAITDARGVPLAANKDNVLIDPKKGDKTVLTIDLGMQQQLEQVLKKGVEDADAPSGGAIIMEVATGKVKAMANYPTFDPAAFSEVSAEDVGLFENPAVSSPLEVGSIMKPLTMAAALDKGVVARNSSYYDPYIYRVDGAAITNVQESGSPGEKRLDDILQLSLNTGATWLLMQMGGGEINQQARETWFDYMHNHYQFGKKTGIEQGYEAGGFLPDPNEGFGLDIQYANSAFGQGMTATPLQMAAAYVSVLNGGTYYRPQLVEYYEKSDGNIEEVEPEVVRDDTIDPETGRTIAEIMEYVFQSNHRVYGMPELRNEFMIGSKTGTAQIANPEGGYYEDRDNGMFAGFVGGDKVEYVVIVRVDTPKIAGYAGSKAAGPIFVGLANMLIDNFGVTPKTGQ